MKPLSLTVLMLAILSLFLIGCTEEQRTGSDNSALGLPSTNQGSIQMGSSATDTLEELTEAHDWTFAGREGQVVTIRCEATAGEDTDPRINLLDPNGDFLIANDDSGGELAAQITSYTLPEDGTYTIKVDIYTGGEYRLSINED